MGEKKKYSTLQGAIKKTVSAKPACYFIYVGDFSSVIFPDIQRQLKKLNKYIFIFTKPN